MTENEAKTLLENKKEEAERITNNFLSYSGGEIRKANRTIEMCDMAIQAIEEIQQYRAIGTVKEIKIREAQFKRLSEGYLIDLTSLREYRAIGTIEEFKALKEKSNKDFELLLKAVKESYPMFKGAYVEVDVFMGDVMRRFARDRKEA